MYNCAGHITLLLHLTAVLHTKTERSLLSALQHDASAKPLTCPASDATTWTHVRQLSGTQQEADLQSAWQTEGDLWRCKPEIQVSSGGKSDSDVVDTCRADRQAVGARNASIDLSLVRAKAENCIMMRSNPRMLPTLLQLHTADSNKA